MASKGIVKFNVGGTRYEVARSLLDACPDSMLARIVSKEWHQNEETEIFIERDGTRFKYCLDVLRDGKVSLPLTVSKSAILEDLIYYGIGAESSSISYDHIEITNLNGLFLNRTSTMENDLEKLIAKEKALLEEIELVETTLTALKERGAEAKNMIRVFHGARIIYEKIISDIVKCGQSPSKLKIKFDPKKEEDHLAFVAKKRDTHFNNLKDILDSTFGIELISLSVENGQIPLGSTGSFGSGTVRITFPSNNAFAANSVVTTTRQDSSYTSYEFLVVEFIVTTGSISNE